jgi:predicted pyridoxine 5'-phosphate oxidase superfamily flavin-nucleotide-binding protein
VVGEDETLLMDSLVVPGYRARPERGILVTVEAFDWNCPQHITPRYTEEEWLDAGPSPMGDGSS